MAITCRFGIEPIPYDRGAGGSFSQSEYVGAISRSVQAGADNLSWSSAWDSFETAQGVYNTSVLGYYANGKGSAKMVVTIAVIAFDGTKNLPAYIDGQALDSTNVKTAFRGVIDALHTTLGQDGVDVLALANECEAYLESVPADIDPFAALIADAKTYATGKAGWSGVKVTASFKHDTPNVTTTYASILAACSMPAFTYYPLNPDFTVAYTNPATIGSEVFDDILALPTAVAGTVILTEMGFPSSPALNSSETLQAAFYRDSKSMVQLIADFDGVYSCQYQWLTDWPDWLLDLLGYTDELRDFVGSLGVRTTTNRDKAAWTELVTAMGGRMPEDVNTRVRLYLKNYYGASTDASTAATRYLNGLTGDGPARFQRLVQDASDALQ